jgi:hypothetical protein
MMWLISSATLFIHSQPPSINQSLTHSLLLMSQEQLHHVVSDHIRHVIISGAYVVSVYDRIGCSITNVIAHVWLQCRSWLRYCMRQYSALGTATSNDNSHTYNHNHNHNHNQSHNQSHKVALTQQQQLRVIV